MNLGVASACTNSLFNLSSSVKNTISLVVVKNTSGADQSTRINIPAGIQNLSFSLAAPIDRNKTCRFFFSVGFSFSLFSFGSSPKVVSSFSYWWWGAKGHNQNRSGRKENRVSSDDLEMRLSIYSTVWSKGKVVELKGFFFVLAIDIGTTGSYRTEAASFHDSHSVCKSRALKSGKTGFSSSIAAR